MELPKDACGVEIPLSTKELFDKDGNVVKVQGYEFFPRSGHWYFEILYDPNSSLMHPGEFYIEKPESWKEIREDLLRLVDVKNVEYMPCVYADAFEEEAGCIGPECRLYKSENSCAVAMVEDIAHRVNKMVKVDKCSQINFGELQLR